MYMFIAATTCAMRDVYMWAHAFRTYASAKSVSARSVTGNIVAHRARARNTPSNIA